MNVQACSKQGTGTCRIGWPQAKRHWASKLGAASSIGAVGARHTGQGNDWSMQHLSCRVKHKVTQSVGQQAIKESDIVEIGQQASKERCKMGTRRIG